MKENEGIRTKLQWLFFAMLFLLYSLAPRYISPNHGARFALAMAIVYDHSFIVDKYMKDNVDWSSRDGHLYANKAPGSSFLMVPFLYVYSKAAQLFGVKLDGWDYRSIRWCDIFVTALPSTLLAYFMLLYFRARKQQNHKTNAMVKVFAYACGTIAYVFSIMLWGHQTAAFFLFVSFYFLTVKRNFLISGFCFSMAVLIEYSAALCLFPLGYLLLKKAMEEKNSTINSLLKWGMAGIPCLALFFFYHKVAFGGYLTLPQAYQNPVFVDQGTTAFMGVLGIPSLNVCYLLLLGAKRGLLLISPVLIFTFFQIPRSFSKQNPHREEFIAAFFCFVAFFYFNAAFNGWHGGGSSGPRYLIPGLPFLALFLLQAKNSKLFRGLLFISAFNICLIVSSYTLLAFEKGHLWKNMFQILVQEHRYFWPFIPVAIAMLLLYCLARKIDQYE